MDIHLRPRRGSRCDTTDPVGRAHRGHLRRARPADHLHRRRTRRRHHCSTTPHLGYDDAGNLTRSTTPLGHTTHHHDYNTAGEPTKVTDPTGRFTQTSYDLAGRAVSTVAGQGTSLRQPGHHHHLRPGRPADVHIGLHRHQHRHLRHRPAHRHHQLRRGRPGHPDHLAPQGRPTYYGYDTAGQLTAITQRVDPANPATAITVSLGYDRAGNKTRMVDGNGNATTYTYNTVEPARVRPSNRPPPPTPTPPTGPGPPSTTPPAAPSSSACPAGSPAPAPTTTSAGSPARPAPARTTTARSLDYDPLGRVTSATSPAGNLTFTWTDRGLLATAAGYGGTATYTYDGEDQPHQPHRRRRHRHLHLRRRRPAATVADPLTATTATNTYDTAGRLATITYGAGKPTRDYTYDNLGRIATDTTKQARTAPPPRRSPTATTTTTCSPRKTTTGLTGAGANTYTYDGLAGLTSWLNPGGTTTTYGYDAASNRTTVTTPAGTRTSTFDERNRITGTTGAGATRRQLHLEPARAASPPRPATAQTTTYTFDAFERLTQAPEDAPATPSPTPTTASTGPPNATRANFGYNDLTNNADPQPAAAGETKLLRDPAGAALAAKTGTSAGNARPRRRRCTATSTATVDPTTGDLGASTTTTRGARPPPPPAPCRSGYQGGYTDPDTGLVNAHARWYDPSPRRLHQPRHLTLARHPARPGQPLPLRQRLTRSSPPTRPDTSPSTTATAGP